MDLCSECRFTCPSRGTDLGSWGENAHGGILAALDRYDKPEPVNLGSGREISIRDLVEKVAALTGFHGQIVWDASKPNGQPRRCLDVTRAENEFGFRAQTSFDRGLRSTIDYYLASQRQSQLVTH